MPTSHVHGGMPEHSLFLHQDAGSARRRLVSRVADALQRGEKVIHTHLDDASAARRRLSSWLPADAVTGDQLELVDAREERRGSGGEPAALVDSQARRIERARRDGFPGVLCTADDGANLELALDLGHLLDYERGLHALTEAPDTTVLCSYDLGRLVDVDSGLPAVLSGIHFRRIDDLLWTVRMRGGILCVGGELDHSNGDRVREVLLSAVADDALTVDLRAVTYVSADAVRAFEAAADRAAEAPAELRLVRVPAIVAHAFSLAGLTSRGGVAVQPSDPSPPQPVEVHGAGASADSLRVAGMFSELTRLEAATSETEATTGLAGILAGVISPAADVSVTIGPPVNPRGIDSNSQLAQKYDGLQMQAGEGPCQSAWDSREMVLTSDLREDPRWPELTRLAEPHELASVLALPVHTGEEVVGVINAYATEPGAFEKVDIALAELAAYTVGLVFERIESTRQLQEMVTNLRHALASRSVIDQAKGVLMARHGYDADTAFLALSELSQRENIKVRDLAQLIADDVQAE